MIRLIVDVHEDRLDLMATKESVAMLPEPLGRVRVVSVIYCAGNARWKGHVSFYEVGSAYTPEKLSDAEDDRMVTWQSLLEEEW